MNGPFTEEYWEAVCIEIETLEKIDAWDVVERLPEMNVLPSTFKTACKFVSTFLEVVGTIHFGND